MNLELPNATVTYTPDYINVELQNKIFTKYQNIFVDENNKYVTIDDRNYKLNRKTLVLIDENLSDYVIQKIWGENITVMNFDEEITEIKNKLEKDLQYKFNICLCNYYPNGKSNISFR
jgi:hypothetical protein